ILYLSASTIAAGFTRNVRIDIQAIPRSAPQRSSRRRAKFGSLGTILAGRSANSSAALVSLAARLTLNAADYRDYQGCRAGVPRPQRRLRQKSVPVSAPFLRW